MGDDRKLTMLCAVLGRIGTDDHEHTKTIRDPSPAFFSPVFPATFPQLAVYTEWTGTGRWAVSCIIMDRNGDTVHEDHRPVFDCNQGNSVRLVLDFSEVVFPTPGPYVLGFLSQFPVQSVGGRGFWMVQAAGPVLKHRPIE